MVWWVRQVRWVRRFSEREMAGSVNRLETLDLRHRPFQIDRRARSFPERVRAWSAERRAQKVGLGL